MGDDYKAHNAKFDLQSVLPLLKKGGMDPALVDEMYAALMAADEKKKKAKAAVTSTSTNPCGEIQLSAAQQCALPGPPPRQGYKPDEEWDCFIEYEKPSLKPGDPAIVSSVEGDCYLIQDIANDEGVPVRMTFNGATCIAYPGGLKEDVLRHWEHSYEANERKRQRQATKASNFSMFYGARNVGKTALIKKIVERYSKTDALATKTVHDSIVADLGEHRAMDEEKTKEVFMQTLKHRKK